MLVSYYIPKKAQTSQEGSEATTIGVHMAAVHTRPTFNKFATFGDDLPGPISSFQSSDLPSPHNVLNQRTLSQSQEKNLSEDPSLQHQDDLWHHPVRDRGPSYDVRWSQLHLTVI